MFGTHIRIKINNLLLVFIFDSGICTLPWTPPDWTPGKSQTLFFQVPLRSDSPVSNVHGDCFYLPASGASSFIVDGTRHQEDWLIQHAVGKLWQKLKASSCHRLWSGHFLCCSYWHKVLFANLLSQDYSLSKSCISFVFTDTRKPRDYLLHLVLDAIAGDFSHLLSSQWLWCDFGTKEALIRLPFGTWLGWNEFNHLPR